MRDLCAPGMVIVAVVVLASTGAGAAATAAEPAFWDRVAAPDQQRFDRLVAEARDLLQRANDAAGAARTLNAALALDAARGGALADFDTFFLLAQIESARGRTAPAVEALERAEPLARAVGQKADCWFRLGVERSKLGRYADALAAYDRELALGAPVGTP